MRRGYDESPGRSGASATVEVDPARLRGVALEYGPRRDGDADPGEIVWSWVPYEERDGRGKDRPLLVVARERGGTVLGVQLTSKPHSERWDVAIGSGPWDPAGRPSWVRLERVFRLHQAGIRRESAALDPQRFAAVAARLAAQHGWRAPAAAPRRPGIVRRVLGRLLGR